MDWVTIKTFLNNYGYIFAIVAAALLLILLIAIIASAAKTSKLKRENAKLRERAEADEKKLADIARALPTDTVETKAQPHPVKAEENPAEEEKPVEESKPVEEANPAEEETAAEEQEPQTVEETEYKEPVEEIKEEPVKAKPERKEPQTVVIRRPEPVRTEPENKYTVKYDKAKGNWIIVKAGNTRPTRRVATKAEALQIAKELAEQSGATLAVHKKDGKFQKQ